MYNHAPWQQHTIIQNWNCVQQQNWGKGFFLSFWWIEGCIIFSILDLPVQLCTKEIKFCWHHLMSAGIKMSAMYRVVHVHVLNCTRLTFSNRNAVQVDTSCLKLILHINLCCPSLDWFTRWCMSSCSTVLISLDQWGYLLFSWTGLVLTGWKKHNLINKWNEIQIYCMWQNKIKNQIMCKVHV